MAKQKQNKKVEVNHGALIPGVILIALGLIFLLTEFNLITFDPFYLVLLVGVGFLLAFIISKVWAFLIPGVIVSGVALIFIFNLLVYWYVWPLIVGLSFIAVYLTRMENSSWAIIPGGILIAVSLIGMIEYYFSFSSWPIILIIIGLYIIYKNYKK